MTVDERAQARGAGGEDAAEVRLTYASPTMGPVELHLALAGEQLLVAVRARAGEPVARAEAAAAELREAIGAATGRAVQVRVTARHDPLDVYA